VLHFADPAERGLAGTGFFRAREAESGEAFLGRGARPWVDTSAWKAELTRFGIDYLHLRTDEPMVGKLRYFLKHRVRRPGAVR
jgi:hypothetical protein